MKQGFFEIVSNERLTDNVMELVLRGDTSEIAVPGQFVNIKLDGFFCGGRYRCATASREQMQVQAVALWQVKARVC